MDYRVLFTYSDSHHTEGTQQHTTVQQFDINNIIRTHKVMFHY